MASKTQLVIAAAATLAACASARSVTLSNVQLPNDQFGRPVKTGEASVLPYNGSYYVYMNDWGGCPGIDCCPTSGGCASCCFTAAPFTDPCVYTNNHSVLVYSTPDFATWRYEGVALPLSARLPGIEFRPQVVYNQKTDTFVMWYEDRWSGQSGYAVATAPTPIGPFVTLNNSVAVPGNGRVGDYDIFVDDDGLAYHVRTGMVVVQLDDTYTQPTDRIYEWTETSVEGPAMFARVAADGSKMYYILVGPGCCACRGGSDVEVWTAPSPLGPFTRQGRVATNTTAGHVFDAHSPYNYVTKAQQTKVFPIADGAGGVQWMWMGSQWVTANGGLPGGPRDNDRVFWQVLQFDSAGNIGNMTWADNCTITVP